MTASGPPYVRVVRGVARRSWRPTTASGPRHVTRYVLLPRAPTPTPQPPSAQQRHEGQASGFLLPSPKKGLSVVTWRRKVVMCPRWGNDPASGHLRAHQPAVGERYLITGLGWRLGRTWPTAKAFPFLYVDLTHRSETGQVRGLGWHNKPREWEGKVSGEADGHCGLRRERPREGKGTGRGKVRVGRQKTRQLDIPWPKSRMGPVSPLGTHLR